ncbi:MAG: hypothetical protein P8178_05050 [Candidatus Thiodiazotropha sp.]
MMYDRYARLIPLLLLLGLSVSVQALELQRLSPKVGRPGSAIRLQGRGFGDAMGDLAVVIAPRGGSTRVHMAVVNWSDKDILVRVPNGVTPGVYEISIVSPPSRNPPVRSTAHPLSVLPPLTRDGSAIPDAKAWRHPDLQPNPKMTPQPQQGASVSKPDRGFRLEPESSGRSDQAAAAAATACADPAVTDLQVLHPQRNLDGSYRLGLRVQIRNLGSRTLEAERGQTRLTLRQGARLLRTGIWPGPPMNGIRLEPGRGLNLEIPFITLDARQVAQGLLAGIALRAEGAGDASLLDCNPGNNRFGIDGASLQRALGIRP